MNQKKSIRFYASVIGLLLCVVAFAYFIIVWGRSVEYNELTILGRLIAISGVIGFFSFWLIMLAHFFENRTLKHKVLWGFFLFFFSWLASLLYFFLHFLTNNKTKGHV